MKNKMITLAAMAFTTGSMALANTPLLVNTDFSSYDNWIFGANRFQPVNTWLEFVTAPDAFSYESRVQSVDEGFVFKSWDDGIADKIETYIFQEYGAGPPASTTPTVFETGDVIVFNGSARAELTGANTNDVVVRAFIKVLGYNEQNWAFQIKPEYSAFFNIPQQDIQQDFTLSIVFPDLAVDDSLQVVQIGLEATTVYDGTAMDSAEILFSNLEAYVEGEEETWDGFPVQQDGWVDTNYMGWVNIAAYPWIWSASLNTYIYKDLGNGGWVYIPDNR